MSSLKLEAAGLARTPATLSAPLPFVEAFGPTLQGEGPATGRVADFLRFGGCNLSCSWCDSAYTWNAAEFNLREEITLLTVEEVLERTPGTAPIIVVTGGEPLLNQYKPAFGYLLERLGKRGQKVHIETNGTMAPNPHILPFVDTFVVSPKQPHAGEHKPSQSPALNPGWRGVHLDGNAHLKIVVETAADVERAVALAAEHSWPQDKVWVMPEGTTKEALQAKWPTIANTAAALGVNASHRLHVLAWDDVRGH